MRETADVLKGIKVDMRRHWDGVQWMLEDKNRRVLLVGSKEKIMEEYDKINNIFE